MSSERFLIDPSHSSVDFTVRHLVISKVRGSFTAFAGELDLDTQTPSNSKVRVTIEAASLATRDAQRDGHLRSADFFDVEQHPSLTFESTSASASGAAWTIEGDLTIRGVTKRVTLQAEHAGRGKDPWGGERVAFSATTHIDRRDFGLTWNQALEAGGLLVGEQIEIALDIQAKKA
jgi:polyisoprenoid-binding protein YceI